MRRRILAATDGKPYTPVAGIWSDGLAYSAIPHIHENPYHGRVVAEISLLAALDRRMLRRNLFGASTRDTYHLLNNYWDGSPSSWSMQAYCGDNVVLCRFTDTPQAGERFRIEIWRDTGSHGLAVERNGVPLFRQEVEPRWAMTLGRLGVFTQNNAGAGGGVSPISGRVPTGILLTSLEYWDGDSYHADLAPAVERATGEACLYDLENGVFVKNLGQGEFHVLEDWK